MFIPVRTDAPLKRVPYVNYAIIAINALVYLVTDIFGDAMSPGWGGHAKWDFALRAFDLKLWQFFSYQFLHGDLLHLFFNMLFLWIFGNSVNAKMGHAPYALFYLATGVFAGIGFAMSSGQLCIGASGAVAGVTAAYMVLYPHSRVTVFYFFWLVGVTHIKSVYVILFKLIIWDNVLAPNLAAGGSAAPVAYSAHLAGYFFGIALCLFLLFIRALPRDQYDILALMSRFYKRQQFKTVMADPNARARATYGRVARPVSVRTGRPVATPVQTVDEEALRMRARVSELVAKGDYTGAADVYERLVARDPDQCLPRAAMSLVANQLKVLGRYPQAAAAYEKHLKTYPNDKEAVQIKLMLALIYAKHLQQHEIAEGLFEECVERLVDTEQKQLATEWLEHVRQTLGRGAKQD